MSSFVERNRQSSNIQWGKLAAGAAVATGVVLVGLAIGSGEVPILSDIASGIKELAVSVFNSTKEALLGSSAASELPAPTNVAAEGTSMFASLGNYLGDVGTFLGNNAKSLGGVALLAAGLGYYTAHSDNNAAVPAPALAVDNARIQTAKMGFAAREQMRAVDALMQSRMQAFGQTPPTDNQQR